MRKKWVAHLFFTNFLLSKKVGGSLYFFHKLPVFFHQLPVKLADDLFFFLLITHFFTSLLEKLLINYHPTSILQWKMYHHYQNSGWYIFMFSKNWVVHLPPTCIQTAAHVYVQFCVQFRVRVRVFLK